MFDTLIPPTEAGYSRRDDRTIIDLEDRFGAHHYHQVLKAKFGLLDR